MRKVRSRLEVVLFVVARGHQEAHCVVWQCAVDVDKPVAVKKPEQNCGATVRPDQHQRDEQRDEELYERIYPSGRKSVALRRTHRYVVPRMTFAWCCSPSSSTGTPYTVGDRSRPRGCGSAHAAHIVTRQRGARGVKAEVAGACHTRIPLRGASRHSTHRTRR